MVLQVTHELTEYSGQNPIICKVVIGPLVKLSLKIKKLKVGAILADSLHLVKVCTKLFLMSL